jgi:hypothetical protein
LPITTITLHYDCASTGAGDRRIFEVDMCVIGEWSAERAKVSARNERWRRSPSVPFISPAGAVVRARELYERAGRDWVTPSDAALAWGLGAKSSANLQTISALLAYGLVEAARQDGARRVRLSELASRLFRADLPLNAQEEQQALVEATLKPKLIAEYAARWMDGRPRDADAIDDLKLRHKFTDQAAVRFLQVFDDAMWFVRGGASMVGTYNNLERGGTRSPLAAMPVSRIIVGDYVQWRADGADPLPTPRKVVWISDGGLYLSVEGSRTRFATSEVRLTPPPPASEPAPRPLAFGNGDTAPQEPNQPKIVVRGSRLEISAFLDIAGLQALQRMLPHYRAAILARSSPQPDERPELECDTGGTPANPEHAAGSIEEGRPKPFPVLGCQWAIQHAYWLYENAGTGSVSIAGAAKIWREFGLEPDSSAFIDTIDGLLEFGLFEQSGNGAARTIRISELGWRFFRRPDPETTQRAFCAMALKPKLLANYAALWGRRRPDDAACIAQLVREQGFAEISAAQFLTVFDEIAMCIGHGSATPSQAQNQLKVLQYGDRLKIAADIEVTGLGALDETLICYEKILRLWALNE